MAMVWVLLGECWALSPTHPQLYGRPPTELHMDCGVGRRVAWPQQACCLLCLRADGLALISTPPRSLSASMQWDQVHSLQPLRGRGSSLTVSWVLPETGSKPRRTRVRSDVLCHRAPTWGQMLYRQNSAFSYLWDRYSRPGGPRSVLSKVCLSHEQSCSGGLGLLGVRYQSGCRCWVAPEAHPVGSGSVWCWPDRQWL